jgi:hypothetical protein
MFQECENAGADFIANDADFFDGLALGIAVGPVVATETGDVGTFVTATHGDEELGIAREFFGEFLRPGAAEVDTDFLHGGEHFRMNARTGIRACGDCVGSAAICERPALCTQAKITLNIADLSLTSSRLGRSRILRGRRTA